MKWNEYTWYSKLAAIILFIAVLPAWTFYIGREYEKTVESFANAPTIQESISASGPMIPYSPAGAGTGATNSSSTPTPTAPSTTSAVGGTTNSGPALIDSGIAITQPNNNELIEVPVGKTFALNLSSDLLWTTRISDPSVISAVVISPTGNTYLANKVGRVTISAFGTPKCVAGQACPQFVTEFNVTIQAITTT